MRNERFFEDDGRQVVMLRVDYPAGHEVPPHRHRRDQLLFGVSGIVIVSTPTGTWVMPPQRGMWLPSGIEHCVQTPVAADTHSLYFEPGLVAGMPEQCQVVGISPFMRSLIVEAAEAPAEEDLSGRKGALMTLMQLEVKRLPHLPLSLPIPAHFALAQWCRAFLVDPTIHATIDELSRALGMNRRTFTRLFRRETGMTFMAWRQQACILVALPRLAAGEAVTSVAMDLGYDNPAAFTSMFRRSLGSPPHVYLKQNLR
jgi:AraC-like DNA-binding protein